jgi:tripartite ATP-independent transporter DctM subunit
MTLVIFLGVLLVAILIGIPVAFALLLSSLAIMLQLGMLNPEIVSLSLINGVDSFTLLAIPFFLIAGEVMSVGGLSKRIVALFMSLVGHRNGGLGYVAIATSVVLASLSGSAVADAAALVSILYPMMRDAGYPRGQSLGLLASGGLIAPIIPPSLPLIIVGVTGNLSIGDLFVGGIVPGLLMAAALIVTWSIIIRKKKLVVIERVPWRGRLSALKGSLWALLMPVIIIGGIRTGVVTPTESAVVAAVYAIVVSKFIYRELTWTQLVQVLVNAGRTTAMVMLMVGASMVAAWLITVAQLPQQLGSMFGPLIEHPKWLMLVIMIIVFLVGTVMDLVPTTLVMLPLLLPVVKLAGIDPVYFALMFTINNVIGLITPPVGSVVNVVAGVGRASMSEVVRGCNPFLAAYLLLMGLFILFPEIITAPLHFFRG